jgi:hypothetical protein
MAHKPPEIPNPYAVTTKAGRKAAAKNAPKKGKKTQKKGKGKGGR